MDWLLVLPAGADQSQAMGRSPKSWANIDFLNDSFVILMSYFYNLHLILFVVGSQEKPPTLGAERIQPLPHEDFTVVLPAFAFLFSLPTAHLFLKDLYGFYN